MQAVGHILIWLHSSESVICSGELFKSKTHFVTFLKIINRLTPIKSPGQKLLFSAYLKQSNIFSEMENLSDINAHKIMYIQQIGMISIIIIVAV